MSRPDGNAYFLRYVKLLVQSVVTRNLVFILLAVPEYIHEDENETTQITSEGHDAVDNYAYSEQPQQVVSSDNWGEEPLPEEQPSSFSNEIAVAPEETVQPPPVPTPHVEEPVGEPIKKTYASIVRHFLLARLSYSTSHLMGFKRLKSGNDSCS